MIRALLVTTAIATAIVGVAAPAGADPYEPLWDLIPGGYDNDSCHEPVRDIFPERLAVLECVDNSLPGGPQFAWYVRYPDQDSLLRGFYRTLGGEDVNVPCPTGLPSPGAWHQTWAPNETAGQIACGTWEDEFNLIWTRESDLFLAVVSSSIDSDPTRLVDWWRQHGIVAHDFNPPAIS